MYKGLDSEATHQVSQQLTVDQPIASVVFRENRLDPVLPGQHFSRQHRTPHRLHQLPMLRIPSRFLPVDEPSYLSILHYDVAGSEIAVREHDAVVITHPRAHFR
ncbi:hypothetical protein PsYK624_157200 [Phanerochaete sordida]|uniref:Uncharacterized protein n=1 Tax=Phanerochaete sordida TaxID=48140 RepID=A0A9P3GQT2_9APHY|nr:hypothetical protein PsYK624_157200 [Phanerochaete sordida]